jgi:hypothetical protein
LLETILKSLKSSSFNQFCCKKTFWKLSVWSQEILLTLASMGNKYKHFSCCYFIDIIWLSRHAFIRYKNVICISMAIQTWYYHLICFDNSNKHIEHWLLDELSRIVKEAFGDAKVVNKLKWSNNSKAIKHQKPPDDKGKCIKLLILIYCKRTYLINSSTWLINYQFNLCLLIALANAGS